MTVISFKSVGKTREEIVAQQLIKSSTPIGIKTPLQLGSQDGILVMNHSLIEQIHDNLRNLLLTNWGERVGLYNFGGNLRPLTTEFSTLDNFDAAAMERITSAVQLWMPFISLENYESSIDRMHNKNTAIISIVISYSCVSLGISNKSLEIRLYVI